MLCKTGELRKDGCYVNEVHVKDVTVDQTLLNHNPSSRYTHRQQTDAKYIGGFNIFGKTFGDYEQDIVLSLEC